MRTSAVLVLLWMSLLSLSYTSVVLDNSLSFDLEFSTLGFILLPEAFFSRLWPLSALLAGICVPCIKCYSSLTDDYLKSFEKSPDHTADVWKLM